MDTRTTGAPFVRFLSHKPSERATFHQHTACGSTHDYIVRLHRRDRRRSVRAFAHMFGARDVRFADLREGFASDHSRDQIGGRAGAFLTSSTVLLSGAVRYRVWVDCCGNRVSACSRVRGHRCCRWRRYRGTESRPCNRTGNPIGSARSRRPSAGRSARASDNSVGSPLGNYSTRRPTSAWPCAKERPHSRTLAAIRGAAGRH